MHVKSFHVTKRGSSHIKKNKVCQDDSLSYEADGMAIAVVCDGHGADDYVRSDIGSKLGTLAAKKSIEIFLSNIKKDEFFANADVLLKRLEANIISKWNEAIYKHYASKPFTDAEIAVLSEKAKKKYLEDKKIESAYGTTMIAVAITNEFWFGIHIGDGKCVAVNPEGRFVQPIPWDEKCFLNATTSICDSEALGNFRHFYSEKLPVAVFVGSDGIDDCFKNDEQLHHFYKTILYSFSTSDFAEAKLGLEDYLPRLSAKGSGDDVSIAAIIDMDVAPQLEVVKEFDREKEKARVAENAKKEAERLEAERKRVEEEHAKFQQQQRNSMPKAAEKQRVSQLHMGVSSAGEVPTFPKYCPHCGTKLKNVTNFCGECGKPLGVIQTKKYPLINEDSRIENVKQTAETGLAVKGVESYGKGIKNAEPKNVEFESTAIKGTGAENLEFGSAEDGDVKEIHTNARVDAHTDFHTDTRMEDVHTGSYTGAHMESRNVGEGLKEADRRQVNFPGKSGLMNSVPNIETAVKSSDTNIPEAGKGNPTGF